MIIDLLGDETVLRAAAAQFEEFEVNFHDAQSSPSNEGDIVVLATDQSDQITKFNKQLQENGRRLVVVEIGSSGSNYIPGLRISISFHPPNGPCYQCLVSRVEAATQTDSHSTEAVPSSTKRIAGAIAGEQATMWLNGDASVAGTVIELPWNRRRLLPVPACPDCQPTDFERWHGRVSTTGTERSLEEAVTAAEQTIDDRLGLITALGEAESRPLPYYLATLADTQVFSDVSAPRQSAGVADDWNEAFMKAVGEGLERYCAGVYRESSLTRGTPDEIADAIHPEAFVRPDGNESINGAIPWLPATDLETNETVSVPAEMVLFPPPTRDIRPAITTGLALGNTTTEGKLVGLTEVLERDAAMLAWYSSYEPIGIDIENDRYQQLVRYASTEQLCVSTVLLTQDIDLPVMATAVYRDTEFPRFAVGSAASLDPTGAAISSLQEALQNWMELRSLGEDRAHEEESRIAKYAASPGKALAFMTPDTMIGIESLGSAPAAQEERLSRVTELAVDAGLTPLWTETTPRDLAAVGFRSGRVLVPSAQPLFTGRAYFGERATTIPQELGFSPTLNSAPHPFP